MVKAQNESYQKYFIKLKGRWKLSGDLINAIKPLQEHRTPFVEVVIITRVSVSLSEFVAKHKPVDFDKCAKAVYGTVVGIEKKLGECQNLRCAIPAVAAVYKDRFGLLIDGVRDCIGCL